MSLFGVDLETGTVTMRLKTGYLVGAERDGLKTIGGSSPGAVAAAGRWVYVSNATNDTISVVDAASGAIAGQINLDASRAAARPPFGLASAHGSAHVARAGLNAAGGHRACGRGFIPAGWFTSSVAVSSDGRTLFVSSAKGLGSGPNGGRGFAEPARGLHPGDIMQGTLQVLAVPDAGLAPHRQYREHVARREVVSATHPWPRSTARGERIAGVVEENCTLDGSAAMA
jgi:DNA-binding beta-propeller fold protein YncE